MENNLRVVTDTPAPDSVTKDIVEIQKRLEDTLVPLPRNLRLGELILPLPVVLNMNHLIVELVQDLHKRYRERYPDATYHDIAFTLDQLIRAQQSLREVYYQLDRMYTDDIKGLVADEKNFMQLLLGPRVKLYMERIYTYVYKQPETFDALARADMVRGLGKIFAEVFEPYVVFE